MASGKGGGARELRAKEVSGEMIPFIFTDHLVQVWPREQFREVSRGWYSCRRGRRPSVMGPGK